MNDTIYDIEEENPTEEYRMVTGRNSLRAVLEN